MKTTYAIIEKENVDGETYNSVICAIYSEPHAETLRDAFNDYSQEDIEYSIAPVLQEKDKANLRYIVNENGDVEFENVFRKFTEDEEPYVEQVEIMNHKDFIKLMNQMTYEPKFQEEEKGLGDFDFEEKDYEDEKYYIAR